MSTIVVLGGGVAGLVAATQLASCGLAPIVLEAEPEFVGGRLRGGPTVELQDEQGRTWAFAGEHGMHGIWSPYVNLKALLKRHNIMPQLVPSPEETWILLRGSKASMAPIGSAIRKSPVPAPFHYLYMLLRPQLLNMLSIWDMMAMARVEGTLLSALAIDPLAEGKAIEGMTLADFTKRWPPTIRSLFAGLARNALGAHPESVPVAGFIAFLRFYTLMRRDAWDFSYMAGTGAECISEPLAGVAQKLGAEIRLGCRASQLDRQGEQWIVHYQDAQGQAQQIVADQLIMALDSPGAQALLQASPPTAERAADLRFPTGVPTFIARLWFRNSPRPIAPSGICTGDMIADNFFWLEQIQPSYRAWHDATGGSALEAHIYGPPEVLDQPDAALLTRIVYEFNLCFPELRGQLLRAEALRNKATHTLFTPADPAHAVRIETPWPALYACGDWVSDANPAMYLERATTTGMLAANHVLQALGKPPLALEPHPAPEAFAGKLSALLTGFRQRMLARRRAAKQIDR
jgi:isorenieratene synthase